MNNAINIPQFSTIDLIFKTTPIVLNIILQIVSLFIFLKIRKINYSPIRIEYDRKSVMSLFYMLFLIDILYLVLSIKWVNDGSFIALGGTDYLWNFQEGLVQIFLTLCAYKLYFGIKTDNKFMEEQHLVCPVPEHEEPILSQVKELDFKKLALIIASGLIVLFFFGFIVLTLTGHQEVVRILIDAIRDLSSKGIEKL
jgi:hypothetical protein